MKDKNIIMYDSLGAAKLVTVEAYEVNNPNGKIYTLDEQIARWNNCTHKVCECGKPMEKAYTKCKDCRDAAAIERYNSLPFKEWDGKEPVCTRDGSKYFFDLDELTDYMYYYDIELMDENKMPPGLKEIDLLFCEPINYYPIRLDQITGDEAHENYEPEKELVKMIEDFNQDLKQFKAHSWKPGKIRTRYTLIAD